eukprot:scaffold101106_cov56-Phaeocystis_antarctica.AAC.4
MRHVLSTQLQHRRRASQSGEHQPRRRRGGVRQPQVRKVTTLTTPLAHRWNTGGDRVCASGSSTFTRVLHL